MATGILGKQEVHKSDVFYGSAGIIHGIGVEIQESFNVTYRVYDYDGLDKNGKKRELHFNKSIQIMNMDIALDMS